MHDLEQHCYVIGHRNPDTDAICSAIGYAEFLRQTKMPDARAACCGVINARTDWVLRQAGIDPPPVVMDVRPTAGSICRKEVITALPSETFYKVYRRMNQHNIRALPVIDDQRRLVGIIQLSALLELIMPSTDTSDAARTVETSVENIHHTLEAETVVRGRDPDTENSLIMAVAGSSREVMAERTAKFDSDRLIVIVGNRPEIHELAIERKVRLMVLTGGASLDENLARLAAEAKINILTTRRDTGSTVQLIRCSCKLSRAVARDSLTFSPSDLASKIAEEARRSPQPIYPIVDPENGTLFGVLAKSDLVEFPRQRLVLVDHNEFSQAVAGAEDAEILEVIDHHRLSGNLVSKEPIRFINEPVGSTSTMVASSFRDRRLEPSRAVALCLASGIISDTLNLSSPTTTEIDRDILSWLGNLADVDTNEFATRFFAEGSALREMSPAEAIAMDRKEYLEGPWKISISQIEEIGLDRFWEQAGCLGAELKILVEESELDFACVMVTDITRHNSILLTAGEKAIIDAMTYPEIDPDVFRMNGVVSRKKQLFPELGRLLAQVPKTAGSR